MFVQTMNALGGKKYITLAKTQPVQTKATEMLKHTHTHTLTLGSLA